MAISIANSSCSPTRLGLLDDKGPPPKQSMWHRLGLRRWLGRDDRDSSPAENHNPHRTSSESTRAKSDNLTRRLSRRVGVGLPRSTTFKRQNSERRDRLAPLEPEHRRAHSADRRPLSTQRTKSPPSAVDPRLSAPEVQWPGPTLATTVDEAPEPNEEPDSPADWEPDVTTDAPVAPAEDTLDMELEQRWILNLSMHFRDRSEREKFFVTYAETPNRWRRVTISCDYRDAPPDSLEQDLKELRYQRDKSSRVYESIRESLLEIQFYDTVTNLKLETRDGRLHVHVTEDVNETIPYPPISSIGHLQGARCVPEHLLHFDSHLSGFVYKVRLGGHAYIKKEIPGPDTVDEFLYEINALHALNGSSSVIQVEGIVVDERQEVVKGLLISYADQGALVDILRERWAKQIVRGLCEIHESGYVQGDFTLANIVVDAQDNAKIIDINRRGCPVGWEPPEIAAKIESNQRISMYIGVKTDLYQLGMTLWALAVEEDEPERQPRPLYLGDDVKVPNYYRRIVDICLSSTPRHRLAAKELLSIFPHRYLPAQMSQMPPARQPLESWSNEPRPLPFKGNWIGPPPPDFTIPPSRTVMQPVSQYAAHNAPLERPYLKTQDGHLQQTIFPEDHDLGKRSTLTLADSTGEAGFPSRHSSTSTLNHDESQSMGECLDTRPNNHVSEPQLEEQEVPSSFQTHAMANGGFSHSPDKRSVPEEPAPFGKSLAASLPRSRPGPSTERPQSPVLDDSPNPSFSVDPTSADLLNKKTNSSGERVIPEPTPNGTSHSMPSLLLSALPINPALEMPRQRSFPSDSKSVLSHHPQSSPIQPKTNQQQPTQFLSASRLPINPASKDLLSHRLQPSPIQSEPGHQHTLSLSASQLPINPGSKDLEFFPVQSELGHQHIPSLSASRLPINPALNDMVSHHLQPSPIQPEPGHHQHTLSLSASRLPLNPAFTNSFADLS
ncbi:hypothetical protein NUU61_010164 [Penicillium alfredii]|uniref:Protein kinase domain-containing protein n=1 Tax=Penicillium alfredii TaxID=1506179 RepID=A0A9W9JUE8_9EURO|nr:uncharacterized protein NUU61_010164 [Penicillium alfredii]KAJ5081900.1 hypothetical protein NUU61_010164 [Penicillium alfredii]